MLKHSAELKGAAESGLNSLWVHHYNQHHIVFLPAANVKILISAALNLLTALVTSCPACKNTLNEKEREPNAKSELEHRLFAGDATSCYP